MAVTFQDIEQARKRVARFAIETPIRPWDHLRRTLKHKGEIFLKLETLQNTGAFKVRGAANKILALTESGPAPAHIIAASAGNHAQAVAYVAGRLGIPTTIVMPESAPLVKAAATADYGATVVLHGLTYDEAFQRAQQILAEIKGAVYVHAYEDPLIIAGQGTLGLELHEQLNHVGCRDDDLQLVVPIGGGGLVSGVATAFRHLRPKAKIFGVVAAAAPAMAESFRQGKLVQANPATKRSKTLGEGLAVKNVSQMTFEIIHRELSEIAIVDDDEMARAISVLMERGKLVVEGSGAAGVAACLSNKFMGLDPNKPTAFVLCGGNIDMNLVSNILERGLTRDGRWLHLNLFTEDKPGELARVAAAIGALRANILEVAHERISPRCPVGYTMIRFHLETRGHEHAQQIRQALESAGWMVEVLTT